MIYLLSTQTILKTNKQTITIGFPTQRTSNTEGVPRLRKSTLIRHRSNTFTSDRCLIDVDSRAFAVWSSTPWRHRASLYSVNNSTQLINPQLINPWKNKANLRDLIAATGLIISLKLDSNRRFWPWNLMDDLKKGTSSMLLQALCIIL